MKKFFSLLLISLVTAGYTRSQSDSSANTSSNKSARVIIDNHESLKRVIYFFNIQVGSLIGGNSNEASFATTHGVLIGKKFRGGFGVGFDSYTNWQAVPVYITLSWDVIGNRDRNAVYVQWSYGWAYPWFVKNGEYENYASDPFTSKWGGRMMSPAIGYRMKYHDLNLAISVGYKYQRIFYESSYNCPSCNYFTTVTSEQVTQDFNRVQIMMTVGWK